MVKGPSIILVIGIIAVLGAITKVFPVPPLWIAIIFVLWFLAFYMKKHKDNKRKNTPSPVYLAPPPEM